MRDHCCRLNWALSPLYETMQTNTCSQCKARLSVIFFVALLVLPVHATAQTEQLDRVQEAPRPTWMVPVLVLRYFPVTADKQNIDISVTSNVGEPLKEIQKKRALMT